MDLVSVILPVYNRSFTINRAIDSVLNQSYGDIELIIVDDASDDNTVELIKQYNDKRIVLIQGKSRGGAAKARNIGIKIAKGKYIAFQDSDDEWMPCKLEKQLSYMKRQNCQVSFTPYRLIGESTLIVPYHYSHMDNSMISTALKKGNIIGTPTLVMEKEVIDNVGVFDESMSAWEDYELIIRIAKKYSIGCVKEILLDAYRQKKCISNNYGKVICSEMYIMRKHADFVEEKSFLASLEMWINTFITDCAADFTAFEYDIMALTQSEKEYLNKVFLQAVCKRYNTKSYCLETMCEGVEARLQNGKFYIYGAGVVAQKTYERLKQKHIVPLAFVVTTIGKDKKIDAIPVIELGNCLDVNLPLLIAVSPKYHKEIVESLRKIGHLNYSFAMETINM